MITNYWEKRYQTGQSSGAGSYGKIGEYKAKIINTYIKKYSINTIIDLGCGDGHQLMKLDGFNAYTGFDISKYIIEACRKKFVDNKKMIFCTNIDELPIAELSLSLDVIYHILDEKECILYLSTLFDKSTKYVLIFSTNYVEKLNNHILHRRFTDYIDTQQPDFKLIEILTNTLETSANFYLYERK